jgi:hypothetical protein
MPQFSTVASIQVCKGGEFLLGACRRLRIKNGDEWYSEAASLMREARDGQTWVTRISERGGREHCSLTP